MLRQTKEIGKKSPRRVVEMPVDDRERRRRWNREGNKRKMYETLAVLDRFRQLGDVNEFDF